jgi:Fe-coproporphyrin III synthase
MDNRIPDPELIVIDLNNRCNLSCKMCDVGTKNRDGLLYKLLCPDEEILTLDLLKKFIDEIAAFKPEIQLGGADLLLYKDIVPFCEYIVSRGLPVTAVTNGFLLPRYAEILASLPLDTIHVSLDGPPDVHNYIRGNDRSFQNAYKGMESIVRYRGKHNQSKPVLNINYAIFNLNFFCINDFLDSLNGLPLNVINFRHMTYITDEMAHAHNQLHGYYVQAAKTCIVEGEVDPRYVNINVLWEEMQRVLSRSDYLMGFSPQLDKQELEDYYRHPEKLIGANRCPSPWQRARLKANGDIAVGHICYPLAMGNITSQSFQEIWNGMEFNQFRKFISHGLTPACTRCCAVE